MFTTTELLAATQTALSEAGYSVVSANGEYPRISDNARLLENKYSVVMVATFETWQSLVETWPDYQNTTVEAMSAFLTKGQSKAADGYLVLLTPSPVVAGEMSEANRIRSDTSRLRKLLGTGDELRTISDVRKVIASLLPLSIGLGEPTTETGLDALPRILGQHGIPTDATRIVVEAFRGNIPILQRLHDFERQQ